MGRGGGGGLGDGAIGGGAGSGSRGGWELGKTSRAVSQKAAYHGVSLAVPFLLGQRRAGAVAPRIQLSAHCTAASWRVLYGPVRAYEPSTR